MQDIKMWRLLAKLTLILLFLSEIQSSCFDTPDENCSCQGAYNYKGECVEICQPNEDRIIERIKQQSADRCIQLCHSQGKFLSLDQKTCLDSCPEGQYTLDNKYCLKKCPEDYQDDKTKKCLICDGVFKDGQCLKECPILMAGVSIQLQKYNFRYNRCQCSTYKSKETNECIADCNFKEGYLYDDQRLCYKKENCKGYISIDERQCLNKCEGDVRYCQFCFKYLQIDNLDQTPPKSQCVDKCSSSYPYMKIDQGIKMCITQEMCSTLLLATNKQNCSTECFFPDIYEKQQNGEIKCVKQCSSPNSIIKYDEDHDRFECIQSCKYKISSNNKYCVGRCSDIYEVEENDEKCMKCKQGEFGSFSKKKKFACSPDNNDQATTQIRLDNLKSIDNDMYNVLQEQKDYFNEQFQKTLIGIEQNFKIKDKISDFIKIILSLTQRKNNQYIEIKSKSIKIIVQSLNKPGYEEFNKSLSLTYLKSENAKLNIPYFNELGKKSSYRPLTLMVIISQKNYFCTGSKSPSTCIEDIEMIQIKTEGSKYEYYEDTKPIFTLFFDKPNQNDLSKFICLTTTSGVMSQSLKTEVSSNPSGIKCSFRENVALFFDSQGIFTNQSLQCPSEKPYILNNECVQTCPELTSDKKICVSKEECLLLSEDGKQCLFECPKDAPYKVKTSIYQSSCQKSCEKNQIPYQKEMKCLSEKNECIEYLIDENVCSSKCPIENYIQKNDNTPYISCNSGCDLYKYYSQDGKKFCTPQCLTDKYKYITDKDEKMCLNSSECKKYLSYDGKECLSQCVTEEFQYSIQLDGQKYCKICRKIIKEETDSNKNKIITCVDECAKDEMIYIFENKQNLLKKCVPKDFCVNKKISAKNPKVCSDLCIKPEINSGNQCVEQCEVGLLFSPKDNSCVNQCDQGYYSSDEKLCVPNCEKIFEVIDEPINDKKKKCKKCDSNYYLSFINDDQGNKKAVCQQILQTEDIQKKMKKDLVNRLKQSLESVQEVEAAQKAINQYAKSLETKLIDERKNHGQSSLQGLSEISSVRECLQAFLSNVDTQLSVVQKPVMIATSEFIVTSQVIQPGKRFSLKFNSHEISKGQIENLLETDPEESQTSFKPYMLQLSYVKKNPFCDGVNCSSLFIANNQKQIKIRILDETSIQQFQITYAIPQGQESSKQLCASYDINGDAKYSKGEISNDQINCKFEYGSALFYDQNCQHIDNKNCKSNDLNEEQTMLEKQKNNDDNNKLSGGAIAGIVIGVIAVIGLSIIGFVYFLKKKKSEKVYLTQNQQQQPIQVISDNKLFETENQLDKISYQQ